MPRRRDHTRDSLDVNLLLRALPGEGEPRLEAVHRLLEAPGAEQRPGEQPERTGAAGIEPHRLAEPALRRSEEHTSELQSHHDLVCRLLLEKKKKKKQTSKTREHKTAHITR